MVPFLILLLDTNFDLIVYVWVLNFALFEPYVRFHIILFSYVRVTECPPIGQLLLARLAIGSLNISTLLQI